MAFDFAGQWGPEALLGTNGFVIGSGREVRIYTDSGATTLATLYTDRTKGATVTQPVLTDSLSNLTFYANPGTYYLRVTIDGTPQSIIKIQVPIDPDEADVNITDHGDLDGLEDDDHTQYLNTTRGDSRYWQLSTDLATQEELDAHTSDTTGVHGIADTSDIVLKTGAQTITGLKTFQPSSGSNVGLIVKGHASQTADFFQVQNSGGTPIFYIDSTGLNFYPGSGAVSILVGTPSSAGGSGFGIEVNGVSLWAEYAGVSMWKTDSLLSGNSLQSDSWLFVGDTHENSHQTASSGINLAAGTTAANGIAFGEDTNIYRSASDTLKTDDDFVIASGKILYLNTTKIATGTGAPENAVTAPVGSLWLRTDGGTTTTLYVKESGSGNTGWVAAGAGGGGGGNTFPLDNTFSATTDDGLTFDVTGDTNNRFVINANGKLEWGGGSAATNVAMYYNGSNLLHVEASSGFTTTGIIRAHALDATNAVAIGAITIGSIGSPRPVISLGSADDTWIYRSSAGIVRTPNTLEVDTAVRVGTSTSTATAGLNLKSGTTAAEGIAFGTDTNLYRATTSSLYTDDHFTSALTVRAVGRSYAMYNLSTEVSLGDVGPSSKAGIQIGFSPQATLYVDSSAVLRTAGSLIVDTDLTVSGKTSVTTSFNQQSGTSYTLVLADRGKLVECSNASAITLTVPPNSSVAYPTGTVIDILQTGAGQVTVAPGSGVTINATPGLKLRTQWSSATLIKRSTDTWVLVGDLIA